MANSLRDNQSEVIRRWQEHLGGNIAEEFAQMMMTSMGSGVASGLLALAIEFLEAEEYQRNDLLHNVRQVAQEASFRRSAVGFCLADIVFTALALRRAMEETIFNHVIHNGYEDDEELLGGILSLNRFGDAMISGEISGFFAFQDYRREDDDRIVA